MDPVDLPAAVQEGPRLQEGNERQLVYRLQVRAGKRGSRQRRLRALRQRGRPPRQEPVDAEDHRLRGQAHRRSGRSGLHRARRHPAEELDRPQPRRRGQLRHHRRRHPDRLHHPLRHPVRRYLHGRLSRARHPQGVAGKGHHQECRRRQGLSGRGCPQERLRAQRAEQGKDRRPAGRRHGHQPRQRQGDPHLHLRLRSGYLRHWCHHGRACPRYPRLGVRQEVWPAHHRGRQGQHPLQPRRGCLHRRGHRYAGQLRLPGRPVCHRRQEKDDRVAGSQRQGPG